MAMLFRNSTQRTQWMMDEEQLVRMEDAKGRVEQDLRCRSADANRRRNARNGRCLVPSALWFLQQTCRRSDANQKSVESIRMNSTSDIDETQLVTLEEEGALQLFYQGKCQELCRKLGLPRKVQATSIAYIKRMYLKYSMMDHSPRLVMLTSLYLAGKTEESYISAERIAEVVGEPTLEKAILKFETQIIQDLDFQLIVFNPYRSLEGFCIFLRDWLEEISYDSEKIDQLSGRIKTEAYQLADRLLLSDAVFLYPPSQCALAMMRLALQREGLDAAGFVERTCKQAGGSAGDIEAHLNHMQNLLLDAKVPSEDRLKKIDLKLKQCRNPLFDKTSKVYKKMKQEEEQRKAERKRKKHLERTKNNNARNPLQQQAAGSTEGKRRRSSMD